MPRGNVTAPRDFFGFRDKRGSPKTRKFVRLGVLTRLYLFLGISVLVFVLVQPFLCILHYVHQYRVPTGPSLGFLLLKGIMSLSMIFFPWPLLRSSLVWTLKHRNFVSTVSLICFFFLCSNDSRSKFEAE